MRRMLAITVLMSLLIAAIPARAVSTGDEAQTRNAYLAAKRIHGATVAPGAQFSFNKTVGPRTAENGFVPAVSEAGEIVGYGCAHAATAVYQSLKSLPSGAVAFDELSYASDGSGLLVDYASGRDFRFTNLSGRPLTLTFSASGGNLSCTATLGEAAESAAAAPKAAPPRPGRPAAVTLNCGSDPAQLSNIALAAGSVYDFTLASGDVFSFNDVVGPREERFGYLPAANGCGDTVPGGGVDRLASALWLLIQDRDDIVIVEKSTYGSAYCSDYVAHSADAILVDYAAGADFAFRYTGPGSLTLYASLDGSALHVTF